MPAGRAAEDLCPHVCRIGEDADWTGMGQVMNKIICGDCADIMPGMPAESVDLIVTSPPYFDVKTYSSEEDQIGNIHVFDSYISKLLEVWQAVSACIGTKRQTDNKRTVNAYRQRRV